LLSGIKERKWAPYLLFLPTLAFLTAFVIYPIVKTFGIIFIGASGRLSLDHLSRLLHDSTFWKALKYTLLFICTIVPLQVLIAFLLALFINRRFRGYTAVLYLIALPLALSDVSAALLSYDIFTSHGFLNKILLKLGIVETPVLFFGLGMNSRAFWVVVLTEVWRATPLVFIILLAGLQVISREYFEAADVFGFTGLQKFFHLTLPLLMPSLQSALLIRTLFAFQIFGVVWLLAGRDLPVLAGEAYYNQANLFNPPIAASYGFVIALACTLISWVYITVFRSRHLEG
jgi:multiple sugar transport system permease protein